jgi:4-amino-4-deoxy-L-arabinose transferase-like glycosyltransferase
MFLGIALFRGGILFTGQAFLRSDEAVVGLMAKHIATRSERPLFLYGQPYGGGHSVVAYVAVVLFQFFGVSGPVLTAVSVGFSLALLLLFHRICRFFLPAAPALWAMALLAFLPPANYQVFLINGGTEALFFGLLALYWFLRAEYPGGSSSVATAVHPPLPASPTNGAPQPEPASGKTLRSDADAYADADADADSATPGWSVFFCGACAGFGYYAMDYGLLFPAGITVLWFFRHGRQCWKKLLVLVLGFLLGALPLVVHNITHDFEHLRRMSGANEEKVPRLAHLANAVESLIRTDFAAFLRGEIDDLKTPDAAAWLQMLVYTAALLFVLLRLAPDFRRFFARFPGHGDVLPARCLPLFFFLVYLGIYLSAKFSLPWYRTPRYFIPWILFLPAIFALTMTFAETRAKRFVWKGGAVFLILIGAVISTKVLARPWHEEHRINTSGANIRDLAGYLDRRGLFWVRTPYEIQWRLMFESNEKILASARHLSPWIRYPAYEEAVSAAIKAGKPYAFVFRRDFAFAEWAASCQAGSITRDLWTALCRRHGVDPRGEEVGREFVVFASVPAALALELE